MLGVIEELSLELEAFGVGFDGFEGFGDLAGPGVLVEFAELFGGGFTLAGVVVGELCVPPDAGVDGAWQGGEAVLVRAGLLGRAVLMDEVGAGDEHEGGFTLAAVHVHWSFEGGAAGDVEVGEGEDVDDVVAGAG